MDSSKIPSADQLRELGISLDRLGSPKTYPWPEVPAGEAKGVLAKVTLTAVLSGTTPMNQAVLPSLEQIGVAVHSADRAPWNVRLSTADLSGIVTVRVLGGAQNAVLTQPERTDQAAVDLVKAGTVLISGPHGDVLATSDSRGVTFTQVTGIVIEPASAVEAPVMRWLAEAHSSDQWLQSEVSQLLQRGGPWANFVAAAVTARYLEPQNSTIAKEWWEATVARRTVPALAAPRQWARQLESAQLRTVQQLARAEVTRLMLIVDDVAESAIPGEGPWQSQWLDVCHGRDDLEGTWVLLREAGADEPLVGPLDRLDKAGRVVRDVLPSPFVPRDERTRRASRLSPGSWWASSE